LIELAEIGRIILAVATAVAAIFLVLEDTLMLDYSHLPTPHIDYVIS